jgi:hypothetical protein
MGWKPSPWSASVYKPAARCPAGHCNVACPTSNGLLHTTWPSGEINASLSDARAVDITYISQGRIGGINRLGLRGCKAGDEGKTAAENEPIKMYHLRNTNWGKQWQGRQSCRYIEGMQHKKSMLRNVWMLLHEIDFGILIFP